MMRVIFSDLIPGETPLDDATGLRLKGIMTRAELSRAEAEGIRKALMKYFGGDDLAAEVAPFDFLWAQGLHREMFEDVWEWAGRFRLRDFNLGVPFGQVQDRLYNLFEDLEFWVQQGMEPIEQAARVHHRAVEIHPFINGNGRWARMLTNIWLHLRSVPPVAWPERLIGDVSPIRDEYVAALRAADSGDIGPLLAMHRQFSGKL